MVKFFLERILHLGGEKPTPKQSQDILTPEESERLSVLLEECGEAIQVIGKIQRHGYASTRPDDRSVDNRYLLEVELGHVLFAIDTMAKNGDITQRGINQSKDIKKISVKPWLHYVHKGVNDV